MSQVVNLPSKIMLVIESIIRQGNVKNEGEAIGELARKLDYAPRQIRRWRDEGELPKNVHAVLKDLDKILNDLGSKNNSTSSSMEERIGKLEQELEELRTWIKTAGLFGKNKVTLENVTIGKININEP